MATRGSLYCFIVILAAGVSGCVGTRVSSRPVYPESWASLNTQHACPDLTGKYSAVSEEAAPLVYPAGREPREIAFFVTHGKPEAPPALGRRILTWHLAGVFEKTDPDIWNALTRYAASLETNTNRSDTTSENGWVLVRTQSDRSIAIHAGLHDKTLLDIHLRQEAQGFVKHKNHVYQCKNSGLRINGSFPPPSAENPNNTNAYANFTFYRAVDGSLVMLEEAYADSHTLVFKKWWRWRPIK